MATEVGGQLMRYQTSEIEGKITYQKAIEAKQEREDVLKRRAEADTDRENARAAAKFSAEQKIRLAKAKTPEEAKAIEQELISGAKGDETVEMQSARAVGIESAESEARQMTAEADRQESEQRKLVLSKVSAIRATETDRMITAWQAGNPAQLMSASRDYAMRAAHTNDPDEIDLYNDLRMKAISFAENLDKNAESEAHKAELATANAAKDFWGNAAQQVVAGYRANLGDFAKGLDDVGEDSLMQAVFDSVRDKVYEELEVVPNGEIEEKAVSEAIEAASRPLVEQMIANRNQRNINKANDLRIDSYKQRAKTDYEGVVRDIENSEDMSDTAKRRAFDEITASTLGSIDSDIGRIAAARDLFVGKFNPFVDRAAARVIKDSLKKIEANVELEHNSLIQPNASGGSVHGVGWVKNFNTKEEFLDSVLLKHYGTNLDAIRGDEQVRAFFGPTVIALESQWNADEKASDTAQRREDTAFRRSNPTSRRLMKVEEGWKYTKTAMALADGSHSKLHADELERMLIEDLTGFSDVAVPADLKKAVIDGVDNPANFAITEAFWRVSNRSFDPTTRNRIMSDDKYARSFAVGTYLGYLRSQNEVTGDTTIGLVAEFARNLDAASKPPSGSPEEKALNETRQGIIWSLAQGAAIDGGWFDFTGIDLSKAFSTMSPSDQKTIIEFASMAASVPEAADRGGFMVDMMQSQGYRVFPIKQTDGSNQLKLILNVPGASNTLPLPNPAVLETDDWKRYLDSFKPAMVSALEAREVKDLPGTTAKGKFSTNSIGEVLITPYDHDLKSGKVALKAFVDGRWIRFDSSEVSVNAADFQTWLDKNPAPKPPPLKDNPFLSMPSIGR